MIFHLKSGDKIRKACPNTGHKDCWTDEVRQERAEQNRDYRNDKGQFLNKEERIKQDQQKKEGDKVCKEE